jgi:hypothetical protein
MFKCFPYFITYTFLGLRLWGLTPLSTIFQLWEGVGGGGNKININNKTKTCTYIVTNSTFLLHAYYDKTVYYCTFWLTILDLKGSP